MRKNYTVTTGMIFRTTALAGIFVAFGTMGSAMGGLSSSGAYLAAMQAQMDGSFDLSASYLTRALVHDRTNLSLQEQLIFSHLAQGKIKSAYAVAENFSASGEQSQFSHLAILTYFAEQDRFDDILVSLDQDLGMGPLIKDLVRAWAVVGRGDPQDAMAIFDDLATQSGGLGSLVLYHKALALASVGEHQQAEDIFASLYEARAEISRRSVIMRLRNLAALGQTETALALLDEAFTGELDPELSNLKARLEAGDTSLGFPLTSAKSGIAEVFYSIANLLGDEAESDIVLVYGQAARYIKPDHDEVILLIAAALETLQQYEQSAKMYQTVAPDSPMFHVAAMGKADVLEAAELVDQAIETLTELSRSHGHLADVHLRLGSMLRRNEDYAASIGPYDTAISQLGSQDPALWRAYFGRGISYERLKDWDKAEADFRSSLALEPDQASVLNYLGYSLIDQGIKLDEAMGMIERAVELRPDSGYIIDSLGWGLYKLGRYQEAVPHLEKAAEYLSTDPIILDHLGDVYWRVGRKIEADFHWKRALSFDPEPAEAERIRDKLKIGLDAVLERDQTDND